MMNGDYMKRILPVLIIAVACAVNAQQAAEVGTIVQVKGKEVRVRHKNPDDPLKVGQLIHVYVSDAKIMTLKVAYPMMSSSRCVIVGALASGLRPGMKVYAGKSETKRFIDNKDGTVDDRRSGLTWAKVISTEKSMTGWTAKESYAKESRLGGYSDWRVPSLSELCTITDGLKENTDWRIDIRKFGFEGVPDVCWTSNYATVANLAGEHGNIDEKKGYCVNFKNGTSGILDNDIQCGVWIVRGTMITDVDEDSESNSGDEDTSTEDEQ